MRDKEQIYTVKEAAQKLGMTRQGLDRRIKLSRLKLDTVGKTRIVTESDLRYLADR